MSNLTRFKNLKLTATGKVKPWMWNGSHVSQTPPKITGMMVRCERAARGEIAMDAETADELAWLDGIYSSDTCAGYLEYVDQFIAEFKANY